MTPSSKLKISLQSLPSTVREKLALYSRGAKKPSGEVASKAAVAETSAIANKAAAEARALTATSADEKPTKKIRRIICS